MRTALVRQDGVVSDRLENGRSEWRVDAMEELEEQDADAEALWRQAVRLGLRHFDDQALGAQSGQVVAQVAQTVRGGGRGEGCRSSLMQIAGTKAAGP